MITGRSASRSSATARSSARASTGGWRISAGALERRLLAPPMNTWSSGKSRNAGPVCGRRTASHASSSSPGISAVEPAVAASLTTGRTNGTWSISCSEPWPQRHRGRAPAEHEHRRAVLHRRGHRAHPVRDPGAGGQRRHARLARDLRPALGGERGGGLVAHVDEVDPLRAAAVVDREQVPAGEREQLASRRRPSGGARPAGRRAGSGSLRPRSSWRGNLPPPFGGCAAGRALGAARRRV